MFRFVLILFSIAVVGLVLSVSEYYLIYDDILASSASQDYGIDSCPSLGDIYAYALVQVAVLLMCFSIIAIVHKSSVALPALLVLAFWAIHGAVTPLLASVGGLADYAGVLLAIVFFSIGSVTNFLVLRSGLVIRPCLTLYRKRTTIGVQHELPVGLLSYIFILFIGLVILYFYLMGGHVVTVIQRIAVFDIQGAMDATLGARKAQYYDSTTYFGQGYFELIRLSLMPVISLYLILSPKIRRHIKLLIFSITCLAMISSLQRWPIVFYVLLIVVGVGIGTEKTKLKQTGMIVLLFGIISILTLFMARGDGVSDILSRLLYRTTSGSHMPAYFAFEIFPTIESFQFGRTWLIDLVALLPGADDTYGTIYSGILGQSWGSAPLTIYGELYANFGYLGICFGFFLLGVISSRVYSVYSVKIATSVLDRTVFALISVAIVKIFFSSTLALVTFLALPLIFLFGIRVLHHSLCQVTHGKHKQERTNRD